MPIICYSLVLLGIIAIAFAVYALIMIGWCTQHCWVSDPEPSNPVREKRTVAHSLKPCTVSTFKYKKGTVNAEAAYQTECVVCLSSFEDEEDVQQLARCRHSFDAPCIDMWLYSHSSCPLCRTPINQPASDNCALTIEQNSLEGQLDTIISSRAFPPPAFFASE